MGDSSSGLERSPPRWAGRSQVEEGADTYELPPARMEVIEGSIFFLNYFIEKGGLCERKKD
jgi:hypothetical protein